MKVEFSFIQLVFQILFWSLFPGNSRGSSFPSRKCPAKAKMYYEIVYTFNKGNLLKDIDNKTVGI